MIITLVITIIVIMMISWIRILTIDTKIVMTIAMNTGVVNNG